MSIRSLSVVSFESLSEPSNKATRNAFCCASFCITIKIDVMARSDANCEVGRKPDSG